ncbi:outer membrane protein assembly factor BamA [Variovorax sp. PCZ-1]|uniref:outer membrane protein assembly factor BamA n=1 Tax=Variovorax sp. PCZ-1 TaxID=2835533 RepID=UPI0020C0F739|nr:outer membrane protein assembly factor BamA [Variovorax sp. PCZ-1]
MHGNAWAIDPFTVRDIRVEGLQRVEPGTIFVTLPFQVGDTYNDDKASAAIRSLFGLGLFKDVRIDVQGNVVVVIVEERPTIADVSFTGTKEFDKEVLTKALREVGLAEGRAFDKALADRAEQELKRQYLNKSLYGAEVITTVTPIDRNRVNLNFNVIEGDVAKIKTINIVGAQAFSESTLKGLFDQDTGGWLSWYTKSDRYSRTKLNADLETLRSYYLTRGYLEFKIDSTQVAISPDKQSISITVNITEGARFAVSGVKLEGNYLGKEEEFKTFVKIVPGQAYNSEHVAETSKAFTDYFGNFGYAFAQVQARPDIDRTNNTVVINLVADPSRRAYVRKINISGNNRTRDEVIRREFRQFEASWYDGEKIKLSRDRVDRLGYFKAVEIDTSDVSGTNDQVDVNVKVDEKPTGNLTLGAGFSSSDKFSFQFKVQQENVFGSGNYLSVDLNTSKFNRVIAFTAVDPYFTKEGVSRAVDVYFRSQKPVDENSSDYRLNTRGASLRFGVPFSEKTTVFFGAGVEQTSIEVGTNLPAAYLAYANKAGLKSTLIPLTVGWSSDTRDSALAPNTGELQRLNGEWGVAGDAKYLRGNYQYQAYKPLNKKFTLAYNAELGWGKGLGGTPFPVFKNFAAGGLGSVRGFEQGTLGPRDITGSYLGGAKKLQGSVELQAPFPGAGNDRTLRVFTFLDIGTVFGEQEKYSLKDMRASTGVGLSWLSPVGPLRLAIANPIRKQAGDKIQRLQFQIGTTF